MGSIAQRLDGYRAAATAGWNILQSEDITMDAVQRAIEALEDNPLFNNAGTFHHKFNTSQKPSRQTEQKQEAATRSRDHK